MQKNGAKKLTLSRETLRSLEDPVVLSRIVGMTGSTNSAYCSRDFSCDPYTFIGCTTSRHICE